MKSGCRCKMVWGRRPEATGSKSSFPRIRDLAGQSLLVDCFHKLINVSSPMSIHNLCHLSCTMVGEGMQTPKNEVCQGDAKNEVAILIFS